MSDLDPATARQLVASVQELTVVVAKLELSMNQFGPVLQSQVSGLTDTTNRVTRIEDRYAALRTRMEENEAAWKEQRVADEARRKDERTEALRMEEQRGKEIESRNTQNRWLITTCITIILGFMTLLYWVAQHVTFNK